MTKEGLSTLRQQSNIVQKKLVQLHEEILDYLSRKPLLKGSIYRKYKTCNKQGCKCMRGKKHGPFMYLSLKIDGRSKLIYIPKDMEGKVMVYASSYQRWRKIRAHIVRCQREMLELLDRLERGSTKGIEDYRLEAKARKGT